VRIGAQERLTSDHAQLQIQQAVARAINDYQDQRLDKMEAEAKRLGQPPNKNP
jgi:hypothetical protein